MECDKNGRNNALPARGRCGFKRKRKFDDARDLQLDVTDPVRRESAPQSIQHVLVHSSHQNQHTETPLRIDPFMSNMDEITYWVYTKRAPCLFNYDKLKQIDVAQTSKLNPISIHSDPEVLPVSKKKKKNNKILESPNSPNGKQQNMYFVTTEAHNYKPINNCKSNSRHSDMDINIKNTPKPSKPRKHKVQTNNKTPNRRNKIVTSTPKVTSLRRSLRLHQQSINNHGQVDSSFEVFNTSALNGVQTQALPIIEQVDIRKPTEEEQHIGNKNNTIHNGKYEEYSDVSGFTANYIRSTKLQSKTPKKVRRKSNKNLMQESRQNLDPEGSNMVMCTNKYINTGVPNSGILNHSTDSSQNVINLITFKTNDKTSKVDQSTSILNFVDSQLERNNKNIEKHNHINDSFQSSSSTALRNPSRTNHSTLSKNNEDRKKVHQVLDINNESNKIVYRTRSRRRLVKDSSVNDLESNLVVLNVATPAESKRKRSLRCSHSKVEQNGQITDNSTNEDNRKIIINEQEHTQCSLKKCIELKKSMDKSRKSLTKESIRDKSGFVACFSDSGSECDVPKPRKFFCN